MNHAWWEGGPGMPLQGSRYAPGVSQTLYSKCLNFDVPIYLHESAVLGKLTKCEQLAKLQERCTPQQLRGMISLKNTSNEPSAL